MSSPSLNGELPAIATRAGSHGAIRSITATPSSSESTATCTCMPQVPPYVAIRPKVSTMRR